MSGLLILPYAVFLISAFVVLLLKEQVTEKEESYISLSTENEAEVIKTAILKNLASKMDALERMASRWTLRGGTPYAEWKQDANNYVHNEAGLTTVEWVDNNYRVRWVEPEKENENAVGLNILFDEERQKALKDAEKSSSPTVTDPFDLVQGYRGFLTYFPVYKNDVFDGFIVGVFDLNKLLVGSIPARYKNDFYLEVYGENDRLFYGTEDDKFWQDSEKWKIEKDIRVYGQTWHLKLMPKKALIQSHQTFLADAIFVAGLVLSVLLAFITGFAQRSREKSALLLEKENLLSLFVRHTPAAVAMFDTQMRYMAASDRWYADYDLKGQPIIGRCHYDIFPEIEMNHPSWIETHKRCLGGEVIKTEEEVFIRENGKSDWLRYELHPWYKKQGGLGGLIMFTEVITERKQMDKMKSEFISTVNHELRTPLTSIQGSLGLLQAMFAKDLDEKGQKLLKLSCDNCERLAYLVDDILDMEKIMAGKMEFFKETVDLVPLVKSIVDQNLGYAEKYNVTFKVNGEFEDAKVELDLNRFNQALTNLISNASKFSPTGGVVSVGVVKYDDKHVKISVEDKGPGISKNFQEKIFNRFAQEDSSATRAKGGTGLGLNISKSIIESLDGTIGFDTVEGEGTTFYIILPTCK